MYQEGEVEKKGEEEEEEKEEKKTISANRYILAITTYRVIFAK